MLVIPVDEIFGHECGRQHNLKPLLREGLMRLKDLKLLAQINTRRTSRLNDHDISLNGLSDAEVVKIYTLFTP